MLVEWLSSSFMWVEDPAAWVGLATLVVLEIVLGIDNLVFIAILADKLPQGQKDKARVLGLSLALAMRFVLLASIAWIVTLTKPLFIILDQGFSGRDIILILGGIFLLFKGTMELHERLEGHAAHKEKNKPHAVFWQVIVQIVILDAIFSLDSVITAVGMIDHLAVMMIAVTIAIGVMMAMAKSLMNFVARHPTVVILCLGFLMMIGFSLVIGGFGIEVPKGYLYAAIGFSVLIEFFNQMARRNRQRIVTTGDLRERTADAVLRLLGGKRGEVGLGETAEAIAEQAEENHLFAQAEKEMIEGVLDLADRTIASIMTPRTEIDWLDLDDDEETLRRKILSIGYSRVLLARNSPDNFVGVAKTKDLMRDVYESGKINLERSLRQPLVIHESVNVLRVMEQLRKSPLRMAVIVDEYGSLEGVVTPIDVLEAIAGDFPDEGEKALVAELQNDGSWITDGWIDVRKASSLLDVDLVDDNDRYSTLAGYLLWQLGHLPEVGETVSANGLDFKIMSMNGRNIGKVEVRHTPSALSGRA